VAMDSGLSSRINLVILDGAHDFRSTFNTGSDEIRKQVRLVAQLGLRLISFATLRGALLFVIAREPLDAVGPHPQH
jgi:hypothetical protein